MTPEQFDAAVARINRLIDAGGAEIASAGWLPGNDWLGTPFDPLRSVAARYNEDVAARFIGLVVWYAVMNRPEMGLGALREEGQGDGEPRHLEWCHVRHVETTERRRTEPCSAE
ncbi:MAG: hypothetical protein KC657_17495 [Myxococcales bacterium]|nr:hypothetical protein [Myxococcales bacterium]MCB0360648.1 hypothetical protein [Bdellovibrionales bacterium]